jgi:hypothetical protein
MCQVWEGIRIQNIYASHCKLPVPVLLTKKFNFVGSIVNDFFTDPVLLIKIKSNSRSIIKIQFHIATVFNYIFLKRLQDFQQT